MNRFVQRLRPIGTLLLLFLAAFACEGGEMNVTGDGTKAGTAVPTQAKDASETADETSEPYRTPDVPDFSANGSPPPGTLESVNPPSNVTGAYLYCEEISDPILPSTQKRVGCAFQNDETGRNIDIVADYRSHAWSFQSLASISSTIAEFPASLQFQAEFLLTAEKPEILANDKQLMAFQLTLEEKNGARQSYQSTLSSRFAFWEALNGGELPKKSIDAGTEEQGTAKLQICRIRTNRMLIPGKLLELNNRSVCYASIDGTALQGNRDTSPFSLLNPSDVLLLDGMAFDELLEWIPATQGQAPVNALTGGLYSDGRPIYICQALEDSRGTAITSGARPNAAQGELTPGLLVEGTSACQYEYFGQRSKSQYNILAWKSSALKKLMERKEEISVTVGAE